MSQDLPFCFSAREKESSFSSSASDIFSLGLCATSSHKKLLFPFSQRMFTFSLLQIQNLFSAIFASSSCIHSLEKRGSFRNGRVCRGLMRLMHFQASGQTRKPRSKNRSRSQLLLWQDLFCENNHRDLRSIKAHNFALPTLAYSAKYDQIILIKCSAKSGKSIWENLQEMNEKFC